MTAMADELERRLGDLLWDIVGVGRSQLTGDVLKRAVVAAAALGAELEREAIAAWLTADDGAKCYPGSGMETLKKAAEGIRARGAKEGA